MPRILVVDDSPTIWELFSDFLTARGYEVEIAPDASSGLRAAKMRPVDLILLDLMMPVTSGLGFLSELPKPSPPVIVVTAVSEEAVARAAIASGALRVLHKPVDLKELESAVAAVLGRKE